MIEEERQSAGEVGQKAGVEQRRHPRYDYSVPVFVRVLVEEETFNPLRFSGRSLNISEGGMLAEIESLSENDYRKLIHRPRMVRVHATVSEAGESATFFGKIVWFDYRRSDRGASCSLGIAFEALHEKEQKVLGDLLSRLEKEPARNQEPEAKV